MKFLIVLILASFMISTNAKAARYSDSEEPNQSFTYGALRLNPGYGYLGIQNQDGSRAVFGGPLLASEFDLIFSFTDVNLALGPFLHYSYSFQKNLRSEGTYSQELNKSDFMYGLKAYISPFFIGFAFGESTLFLSETSGRSIELRTNQLGFLGGIKLFKLASDWNVSLEGWYKTGFFKKSTNPSLTQNTAGESLEIYINFVWSPLFQLL